MQIPGNKKTALASLAAGMFIICGCPNLAHAQSSVTLAWDPSTDPAVAGYKVYQGVVSHVYTVTNNVGKATTATMTNLVPTQTYYFAVTSYNTNGLESAFSSEITYTVPAVTSAKMQMSVNSRHVVLTGMAPALATYAVLFSKDLKSWTTNGSITVGSNSTFQFTDPNLATNASRFYRLRKTSP